MALIDYTSLSWNELLSKTKEWFNSPRPITEALKRLKIELDSLPNSIETITGDYVDDTDPKNIILNDPRPYTTYVAKISQVNTNAPTVTVLENTTGKVITWTRDSTGVYIGTFDIPLDSDGSIITYTNIAQPTTNGLVLSAQCSNSTDITVTSRLSGTLTDTQMDNENLEFRIYN